MVIIIKTFGARLKFSQGMLQVEYPEQNQKKEWPILQIESLHIQVNVSLSSELLLQCIESNIPVFFEKKYEIKAMLWSPQYGSIGTIRKKQALYAYSTKKNTIIIRLLYLKHKNRINLIKKNTNKYKVLDKVSKIEEINGLLKLETSNLDKIRGWEGQCAKLFFSCFNDLLPEKWKFTKREYHKAKHPINILLNYAYGFLYKETTLALIVSGLDPYIGFFHRDQYAKPSLSYDIIEPYRAWMEEVVLLFVKKNEGRIECMIKNGKITDVYKEEFATVLLMHLNNKVILWNKRKKTRQNHIKLDCHALAQYILKQDINELLDNLRSKP